VPPSELCEVVITAPDPEWLRDFSRQLVEDGLCASAHNFAPVRSIYRWRGKIYERTEGRASLHTSLSRVHEIVDRANKEHPYEVPGISTRPITSGNPDYLAWIQQETTPNAFAPEDGPSGLSASAAQQVDGSSARNDEGQDPVPEMVLTVFVSVQRPPQCEQVPQAPLDVPGKVPGGRITDMALESTVVVHAPADRLRGWENGMTAPAPLREQADRLLNEIGERLAGQATETGVNPVWDVTTTRWHVTDFGGFEHAAEMFSGLDNRAHQAVAAWVQDVGSAIGMPGAVAGDVGEVIGLAIPLPIDRPLIEASRVIQVAGIAFAVATGNAPLACASIKAYAHDRLINFMARGILNAASGRGSNRGTSRGQAGERLWTTDQGREPHDRGSRPSRTRGRPAPDTDQVREPGWGRGASRDQAD
jgi:periplasmic divalent cation tolerance protein